MLKAIRHLMFMFGLPNDGRPMNTDVFLKELLSENLDPYAVQSAIDCWVHGDWKQALDILYPEPTDDDFFDDETVGY